MPDPAWLPPLVRLEDHGGDWGRYVQAVYAIFRRDFITSQPKYRDEPVRVGAQLIDGKERTFWHIIQEGKAADARIPEIRRCERIAWVRALIANEEDPTVLSWPNVRGRNQRRVLWLRHMDFVTILEKRPSCWWLWTAYPTERPHTRRLMMEEYESWKKANAAP